VEEVIVWDNSGSFETTLPVTVISSTKNWGASVRYILGGIVKSEVVLFVDDDMIIAEGIIKDLLVHFDKNKIIGIWGRNFHGSYKSGFDDEYDSHIITEPVKVDFILGFLLMIHRDELIKNYYGDDPQEACEVCLQGRLRHLERWVVPSKNWEHLPEQWDENALSSRPEAEGIKEEMYRKYFGKDKNGS
jgi:hypothetical protein